MIDQSYIPAVITAVAGILGILINLAIEIHYKNIDKKIKVKEKMQENLEMYYLPISLKIGEIINKLELSGLDKVEILEYLCNYKIPSAKEEKIVESLKKVIIETHKCFHETTFKYVDDVLLHSYLIRVKEIIENLSNSITYKRLIETERIDFKYFKLFVNRVNDRVLYYNSSDLLRYWYYKRKGQI